jgi:hypothetical protein
MFFYSYPFVVALLCTAFYYKAGEMETGSGLLWAGLSLMISLATIGLNGGVVAVSLGQVALFLGIAVFRAWRDPN